MSYVTWVFLVFLDPRDDAVMATAEYSGPPRELADVQKPIAALLDSRYAPAPPAQGR